MGKVATIEDTALVVTSGFMRLRVACPRPVLAQAKVGEAIDLHTHLHVREDDLSLFGFAEEADLRLFRLLISVSGIGPKSGLEILSAGGDAIRNALIAEDIPFLTSIKGIGKKTAERAIIELREKIGSVHFGNGQLSVTKPHSVYDDAISALEGLGWKKSDIVKRFTEAPEALTDTEKLIRWFLTKS